MGKKESLRGKTILMLTETADEHFDREAMEFVSVRFSPPLVKQIEGYRRRLRPLMRRGACFCKAEFFNYAPQMVKMTASIELLADRMRVSNDEAKVGDGLQWLVVPHEVLLEPFEGDFGTPRMECQCLVMRDYGFSWSWYVKHTNIEVNTATIPYALIGL